MTIDRAWTARRAAGRAWTALRAVASRPPTAAAVVISVLACGWFAFGPADTQLAALNNVVPVLGVLAAAGAWRVGCTPGLAGTSARFWRILAVALSTFATGMIIDAVAADTGAAVRPGESAIYPVGALIAVVALVVFPGGVRTGAERVRVALDVTIVLFGGATFIWYFLVGLRWRPVDGWQGVAYVGVFPALVLVAGFAILRIAWSGTAAVRRATLACFVVAAVVESPVMVFDASATTPVGRVCSAIQIVGLAACAIGLQLQAGSGPGRPLGVGARWRRLLEMVPYAVVVATLGLLTVIVSGHLDARGWGALASVLAICALVLVRQQVSLWENSRLLAANRVLTEQLHHQACHDPLTGLANRTLFTGLVVEALARTRDDGRSIAVLFIDLDDFKAVNDTYGHQAGDELLAAVARRLAGAVAARNPLGRLGGDEFAVLVQDATGERADRVAEEIIGALRRPFPVAGTVVRIGTSVGIAVAHAGEFNADDLLRNADVAMYAAKRADRGRYRTFQPDLLHDLVRQHRLRAALAEAVDRAEFEVHYQPIVDLADGTLHGVEALVRWRDPAGELVAPDRFVPLAEENGTIVEIDRWVLREACAQAARWLAGPADPDSFTLHVNLSARHLHRTDLVADVDGALRAHGLRAGQLTLEITESGLGHDRLAAIEQLRRLSGLGVQLAIDDFGTGYSSLAALRSLPIDVLKIDKTFTDELRGAVPSPPLAEAVIALAASLRMQTVAEGIEEPAQARRLLEMGCRYGQGFHFGRALPPEGVAAVLRSAAAVTPNGGVRAEFRPTM